MTYLVCDDYLREMQAPAFGGDGAAATVPGQAVGTGRTGRASRVGIAARGKAEGAANSRYAAFARKSAALKNVEANPDADPSNPFYGKAVVFTGDMGMPGPETAQAVAELGAHVKSAVSRKTDYLVAGAQDRRWWVRAGAAAGGKGRRSERKRPGKNRDPGRSRLSRPAGAGARAVSFVCRLLSGKNVRLNALSRVRRQLGHQCAQSP